MNMNGNAKKQQDEKHQRLTETDFNQINIEVE